MPKRNPKERKIKLALIEWHDAFDGNPGWVDLDDYKPVPMRPYSVGWIVPDFMEGHITLMGSFMIDYNSNKELHYSTPSHIPMGMVQSITYLDIPDNIKDADD